MKEELIVLSFFSVMRNGFFRVGQSIVCNHASTGPLSGTLPITIRAPTATEIYWRDQLSSKLNNYSPVFGMNF